MAYVGSTHHAITPLWHKARATAGLGALGSADKKIVTLTHVVGPLTTMGKNKRERQAEPVVAEIPLGRYLASTEKPVRDRAIRSLAAFLLASAKSEGLCMDSLEIHKLWKGIFYCFWMSDKPMVQQQLAQELADLVLAVAGVATESNEQAAMATMDSGNRERNSKAESSKQLKALKLDDTGRALTALDFYEGFWATIMAEWHGVDKFRIDKYYMLMRRFVHAGFQLLLVHQWDDILVRRFVAIMRGTGGPLSSNNVRVPDSITYHVCDIYLNELEKAVSLDGETRIPILALLMPFMELAATSHSKQMYNRVMESVLTPFLTLCEQRMQPQDERRKRRKVDEDEEETYTHIFARMRDDEDEDDEDEDDEGVARIRRHALRRIFAAASGSDTYAPSRRKLYELWQAAQE